MKLRRGGLLGVILALVIGLVGCRVVPDEPGLTLRLATPPPEISAEAEALSNLAARSLGTPVEKAITTNAAQPLYSLQAGAPQLTRAFLHTDAICMWTGVGGQFFSASGEPVSNIIVAVVGTTGNHQFEGVTTTGLAPGYGPGGYELTLSNTSEPGIFWMQAFSPAGVPISGVVQFEFKGDCTNNLALINFRDSSQDLHIFLPQINH